MQDSENEESLQDFDGPSDFIQTVSDDGKVETEVVSTNPEPEGDDDTIWVQYVQTVYEPNNWVNTIGGE